MIDTRNGFVKESFYYYTTNGKIFGYAFYKQYSKDLPIIIYLRGGNNIQGKRDILKCEVEFDIKPLVDAGFFVITTMYGGGFKSEGKDEFGGTDIKDVLAIKHVLINKFSHCINIEIIGLLGFSRGGMMGYILRMNPVSWIKFYIIASAPSDLILLSKERPLLFKNVLLKAFGGGILELKKRSRIMNNTSKKRIPMLILHGKNDSKISFDHAIKSLDYCRKNRILADFFFLESGEHGIGDVGMQIILKRIKLILFDILYKGDMS